MADKKITELDVSQTVAADDSVFADVNGSARKVAVSLILALLEDVYATLESPDFTGSPTAPTPADTDNSTRIATTAFLKSVLEDYAKLASPTFTGTPKAPTASTSTNTTQIATTAYVKAQKYAPLASPTFTGTPKTSTPISTDDSTRIPTTAWVKDRIAEANTGGESGGGTTITTEYDYTVSGSAVTSLSKTLSPAKPLKRLVVMMKVIEMNNNSSSVQLLINGTSICYIDAVIAMYHNGGGMVIVDFYDFGMIYRVFNRQDTSSDYWECGPFGTITSITNETDISSIEVKGTKACFGSGSNVRFISYE